ncbi:MAG: metabolite traffic protein EboE [Verrucomicrobia bacterium]|nr:metabolite traffic protein EboE [Verrucomicrobiota bacterium]MCH8510056.1 metabolite traffic protein EboE [Kiritimatiellia bacterium]
MRLHPQQTTGNPQQATSNPQPATHFSYCLNVHPGESLSEVRHAIATHVLAIQKGLSPFQTSTEPNPPFGLGLRIAKHAADELKAPGALESFRELLQSLNLYAFTLNGFPYGAFHQTRVKENVYAPDWRRPERFHYTRDLFDLLAKLLPADTAGSVSTVPLSYGAWTLSDADRAVMRKHFCDLALHLSRIEAETGKLLHIGLEPEPDCTLETTPQTVQWFNDDLFAQGSAELSQSAGIPKTDAERLLRRHIGVCFDTCHVAMQFEDPAASMRTLVREGIRISKVQVSAALETDAARISPEALSAFDDGVYLHQMKSSKGKAWPDIPEWRDAPAPNAGTLRIHCHVPLHWPGDDLLGSTRHTLTPAFRDALRESGCDHIEVETYTFNVLPAALRSGNVEQDMIQECIWTLRNLL